jgi:hypothetical protein
MGRTLLLLTAVVASLYWYPSASFAAAVSQFENGEVNVSFSGQSSTTGPCADPGGIAEQTYEIDYLVEPERVEGGVLHLDICAFGFPLTGTFVIATDDGETLSGTAEGRVVRDDVPWTPIEMTLTAREGTGSLSRLRGTLALVANWNFGDWSDTGGQIEGTIVGTLATAPK